MKKTLFFTLILSLVLLALVTSCNLDASEGLFSEIAASTPSTDVNIKAYLGEYQDAHWYLSTSGVSSTSGGLVIPNAEGKIIRGAALDKASGKILVQYNNTSLGLYTPSGAVASFAGNSVILLPNGFSINGKEVSFFDGTSLSLKHTTTANITFYLYSEDYVLVCDGATAYLISSSGTVSSWANTSIYVGFQKYDTSKFVLVKYDSSTENFGLYKLDATGTPSVTNLNLNLDSYSYAVSKPMASFCYTDSDSHKNVAFKTTSYFDIIDMSDGTLSVTPKDGGFARDLRTAEIPNIMKISEGVYIASTWESYLFQINTANDTVTRL